jgi:hypothetical protein
MAIIYYSSGQQFIYFYFSPRPWSKIKINVIQVGLFVKSTAFHLFLFFLNALTLNKNKYNSSWTIIY